MRAYKTAEKTYIENNRGLCVARFCRNSYEVYIQGKVADFVVFKDRKVTQEYWDKFKDEVHAYLDFDVTDDMMPSDIEILINHNK